MYRESGRGRGGGGLRKEEAIGNPAGALEKMLKSFGRGFWMG